MKYISDGSAAIARAMGRKLQKLPPEAGIIFIAVDPTPVDDGVCGNFSIFLGVVKSDYINASTMDALVRTTLKEDLEHDAITVTVWSVFGTSGSSTGKEIKVV